MANGIPAEGTELRRGDGASPEVFTKIGRLYDLGGVGKEAPPIDVTAFDDSVRRYINGMPTMTPITLGLRYDPADTSQDGLVSDMTNRVERNFNLVFNSSPSETLAFTAIITSFSRSASMDDAVMAQVGLQPTTDFTNI